MKKLCVFCGSMKGSDETIIRHAKDLGKMLGQERIHLIYGGASVGIMGILADSVLENGGKVYGVIPRSIMELEVAHCGLTDLQVVDSMHERKKRMYDMSDGFLALPGGFGTLDEFCEVLTWNQLGHHGKSCALYNIDGYYSGLLTQFNHAVQTGFISKKDFELVDVIQELGELKGWLGDNSLKLPRA